MPTLQAHATTTNDTSLAAQLATATQHLHPDEHLQSLHQALPHSQHMLLPYAAKFGHTELVKQLTASSSSQPTCSSCASTDVDLAIPAAYSWHIVWLALKAAAYSGHLHIVKHLQTVLRQCQYPASASRSLHGKHDNVLACQHALVLAVAAGQQACFQELLLQLCQADRSHVHDELMEAATSTGDAELLHAVQAVFLDDYLYSEQADQYIQKALTTAAAYGQLGLVEHLVLQEGVYVTNTAMSACIKGGHAGMRY